MGLGKGIWKLDKDWGRNQFFPLYKGEDWGLPSSFGPESLISATGERQQGVSHEGARPFSAEEVKKILRVSLCLPCHDAYDDPVFKDPLEVSFRKAITGKRCGLIRDSGRMNAKGEINGTRRNGVAPAGQ